ncbi:MAG: hypothetical protein M3Q23_13540 [Actinomycetota bacterium]|nr:hypothetical protein [Actinomycetota bacterium]
MTARSSARLAWSAAGLTVALDVPAAVLLAENAPDIGQEDVFLAMLVLLAGIAYGAVGALVASRQPGNPLGWLLCLMGLGFAIEAVCTGYAARGLALAPGSLPAARWAAWLAGWVLVGAATPISLLFLLFPNGRLLSRRWWPVVAIAVAAGIVAIIATVLNPKPMYVPFAGRDLHIANPTGVHGFRRHAGSLLGFAGLGGLGAAFAAVVSLARRYRRSRGEERQQIKWLRYAAIAAAVLFVLGNALQFLWGGPLGKVISRGFPAIVALGIPAAFGVAILKYRLYDIERLVNRTLVYLVLTALLAGVYLGAVLGLGAAARSVTRQSDSAVVVAGSTLLVAALFRGFRRRVQSFIDRRFYRRKYDAIRTLQSFTAQLRDEVDLEALAADLVAVVQDTMQPSQASLWLRKPATPPANAPLSAPTAAPGPATAAAAGSGVSRSGS